MAAVDLTGHQGAIGPRMRSRTSSRRRRISAPTSSPTASRPRFRRLAGVLGLHCSSMALNRRPSLRRIGRRNVRSQLTSLMAPTGLARARSDGTASSSIIASTIAVVPTLRKVLTSARLASPTMTWRRRYFWLSQWGSSPRVHDGTLERGLEPDLLLEEVGPAAEIWNGTSVALTPDASVPHLAGPAEHLAGDEVGDHVNTITCRMPPGPAGSSRGSRSCSPCRPSCSCAARSRARRQLRCGACIDCCTMRSMTRVARDLRASAHSGVDTSGWAWST